MIIDTNHRTTTKLSREDIETAFNEPVFPPQSP
jgi:hypothetical protein